MSLQDFVIYDPQSHTHARENLYIGGLGAYLAEHASETIADFFNPERGVILTNRPHDELDCMRAAYKTITSGEDKHDQLIDTDSAYKEAFTTFGTCYHNLRCCGVDEGAILRVFNFDSAMVAWVFDVLDALHGEDKAYGLFHAPREDCYALGWQNFN
ncbi:hypothetical protein [Actinomyces sp. HMSC065F11]|uniref:hypothetical protein n=1 Tax=Actinomyces sp. HMSC065F11 TaxID=1739395 RepID=UPI0008A61EEE|nr:hypothetical protein [Actinomyces sp. HMSC065F11]OFR30556.1 hypothetical protein HMPREF2891_05905 [Actinomyces sp. HMSC065F11]